MDIIHKILNLVAPPFTFFGICFFLPPYLFFKACLFVARSFFSEDVAGRVVLITGASSGIGEHLAYEYAKRGACLALTARRENSLRDVAATCRYFGSPDVTVVPGDVQRVDDCKRMVETTVDHFGRLDHLVNNAGVVTCSLFEDAKDLNVLRTIMDTNFWGSVYMTRLAIPYLRDTRGKIIAISSSASWVPIPRFNMYNASKAATSQFFDTLRVELGSDIGILVVSPGLIESEITKGKFLTSEGDVELDQALRDVLLGGVPAESAGTCAKSIVDSVCRGDQQLTEPGWFGVTWAWKVFFPEVVDWVLRMVYMTGPGERPDSAFSKRMADTMDAKKFLYPESLLKSDIKYE